MSEKLPTFSVSPAQRKMLHLLTAGDVRGEVPLGHAHYITLQNMLDKGWIESSIVGVRRWYLSPLGIRVRDVIRDTERRAAA